MTMDEHLLIDVADLQTVRFVCTHCEAVLTMRADAFKALPVHCPGCERQWLIEGGPVAEAVRRLMHSLRELAADGAKGLFRVGFDLPGPK